MKGAGKGGDSGQGGREGGTGRGEGDLTSPAVRARARQRAALPLAPHSGCPVEPSGGETEWRRSPPALRVSAGNWRGSLGYLPRPSAHGARRYKAQGLIDALFGSRSGGAERRDN